VPVVERDTDGYHRRMSSERETRGADTTVADAPVSEEQRAALRQIRTVGDPVLREAAEPVSDFDGRLRELSERMLRIMHDAPGIGLAAPQVGVVRRVIVYDVGEPTTLVNPEIVWSSDERETVDEGCLSVPGVRVPVERPARVRLSVQDLGGAGREFEVEELEARVIQHELDHLDGVLILERTCREERARALRELHDEPVPGAL
jgi:peptide deformylase